MALKFDILVTVKLLPINKGVHMAKVLSGKALVRVRDVIVSGSHCINGEYVIDTLSSDKKKAERIILTDSEIRMVIKAWLSSGKGGKK